ncbi:MAG: RDD family protein [Luteolibacter sp.]
MDTRAKLDTLQSVELAEGVVIQLRIAGPMPRALAYLMDFLIRVALMAAIAIAVAMAGWAMGDNVARGLFLLGWFLLDWLYPVVFEAGRRGTTPGKRMLGLRVVQASGSPLTVGQAVVRNFLRFIDGMPLFTYAFGLASCLASRRFQRLGDLAAGTVVVYARTPPQPKIPELPPVPPLAPPVLLTADEKHALGLFVERAGLWSPARRVEIANHAAPLTDATGEAGVNRLRSFGAYLSGHGRETE